MVDTKDRRMPPTLERWWLKWTISTMGDIIEVLFVAVSSKAALISADYLWAVTICYGDNMQLPTS